MHSHLDLTMLGVWWVWWALGTFGVVGTALIVWLAPAVAGQLAGVLFKFFVETRLGNVIAVGAICFFIGDVNRSIHDRRDFAATTAAFDQQQKARDARIAQETRTQVISEINDQLAANAKVDKDVKEFENALPPVPYVQGSNPLRVGNDACRLRHIAGQIECGSDGSLPGLSAAGTKNSDNGDHKGHGLPRPLRRIFGKHQQGQ